MRKIGFVSLGCSKNQVDLERMAAAVKNAGYVIVSPEDCDAVIINTCGFIDAAKEEAIEIILEYVQLKANGELSKIIVSGCLAQRFKNEIAAEFPEVDVILPLKDNTKIVAVLDGIFGKTLTSLTAKIAPNTAESGSISPRNRLLINPPHYAYLKIADGCSNKCSYCAIPSIRGEYKSENIESLLAEAEILATQGVKELILIAQDTTEYGVDIYGKRLLPKLLKELCKIDDIRWIRVLYAYPERITDDLLDVIATEPKIVNYLDMPIQHCNGDILKRMNRVGDREKLENLIAKIREKLPKVTLRTTLITGFPNETGEHFEELAQFVKEQRFDRLGVFAYSQEEGTPAADFGEQVEIDVREKRAENIRDMQTRIILEENENKIGKNLEVIVDGYDKLEKLFFGRTKADAPDIDCKVFFKSAKSLACGDFVNVEINDFVEFDLVGFCR